MGTSFLVAPINQTNDPKIRENAEKARQILLSQNENYIKAMQPPDDGNDSESGESPSKAAGSLAKFKKSPS